MKRILLIVIMLICSNSFAANEELSKQAVAFYSDNNYNQTLDTLLRIDEKDRTAQDWLLLGNLLDEKGQKDEAVFMYQKAIAVDKKFYKPYYNLANIFLNEEKYHIAIENYKEALKYNKTNPYIYYNLGCAYLKNGEANKAKAQFLKALELKNDIPEFQYNMAYVYKTLGKTKTAQIYLDNYNKLVPTEY